MKAHSRIASIVAALVVAAAPAAARAEVKLPALFSDHMVLERGAVVPVWGWAAPDENVTVSVAGQQQSTKAGADGKWQARIQPPPAGGPYTIEIAGRQQTVELHEVLVGDVWICAGQSNMQFGLGQARNGAEEIKNANYPDIRYYVVGERVSYSPVNVPRGSWRVVSPATLGSRGGGISAAAYFFARKVRESVHVPIGLVQEAVGGVPAETFTSIDALRPLQDFDRAHRGFRTPAADGRQGVWQLHHALV